MSIILIDNVLFNDKLEERTIRYNNCIVFLILNGTSIFFGLFYLYIFFMIPKYNNSSNSLSLFFSFFNLISNSLYFLIFFELYLYEPNILSLTIKIITMFNPLVILCIYYLAACIIHNLYAPYYNYSHNIEKRFQFYKYLLFILIIVFYLYTLFNINYNDSLISSKNFTFISNYDTFFIQFFYISGFCIILFIIYNLYYVLNKKDDFIISEYQETKERSKKLKNIFKSVISRNIAYIIYFLLAFLPENIIMLIKYVFDKNTKSYYIEYFIIILISFFGSFLFLVKLFDPLMRNLSINLLLFNREFIYTHDDINDENQNLMDTPFLTDDINETIRNQNKIRTAVYSRNLNIIRGFSGESSFSPRKKSGNNSAGNIDVYFSKLSKPIKKKSYCSESDRNDNNDFKKHYKYKEMKTFNGVEKRSNSKITINNNNNLYSDKNDSSREESNITNKNIDKPFTQEYKLVIKDNNDRYNNYNNNNNTFEEQKSNSENYEQNIKSFKQRAPYIINSRNISKNSINSIKNPRNNSIYLTNSYNKNILILKTPLKINNSNYRRNFINNNRLRSPQSSLNIRSYSIKNSLLRNKGPQIGQHKSPRTRSIAHFNYLNEEITSFASMNYHLEVNENLLRMIAISIAIDDCRIYDELDVYKKYYKLTIPWENKDFYTERTKNKKYNDSNIPKWLGINNDSRFTNIQFSIMAYCPFVFHHIRLIDKISIDDLLASLNPIKNIKKMKEQRVLGGRGNNSLFRTWDKKFILKTIDTNEKNIFFDQMIVDFHCFMRESRSILSRVYGLFKIDIRDKGAIYVIVQKNMDDLPFETKLLTFDFKGSTVDRQVITKEDCRLTKEKIWEKYKDKVLKDKDLNITGLKFILNFKDWKSITSIIDSDSSFLQNLKVTDYSLVVFVHKYREEDLEKNKGNKRVIKSKDNKYIFNFCIVDYLGPYNFIKKGEIIIKKFIGNIKKEVDTNFSVLDPDGYGIRFKKFIKRIILDE